MKTMLNFFLLAALILSAGALKAADFVLIANPSVTEASLSKDDVKNILLGTKTRWDSGGNITLAVLTDGAAHDAVIQTFTARTADQFEKYWKKQVFTGKGSAPDSFKTDADMIAFVAQTPGAFGYVTAASGSVKVLKVQ